MINSAGIAQDLFGSIEWVTSDRGFMKCPGMDLHTGKNAKKDCRIITSGAPTIFCLHSSCQAVIEEANKRLRKACAGEQFQKKTFTAEEREKFTEITRQKKITFDLQAMASISRETLFKTHAWHPADMWEESPERLTQDPANDWKLFLNLFEDQEVLWNGNTTDSGSPGNRFNFQTVSQWRESGPRGNFTCPATFKPRTFSRSNENIIRRRFLVIESDILNQEQICAVFKFCTKFMKLRAVINTGGKSLHGWVDFPSAEILEVLRQILPELGCDRALFTASQPVRMPGVMRGDRVQALLYLNL